VDSIDGIGPTGVRDTSVLLTLEKGLRLLDLFDAGNPQWSIRELCEATGESKITVLRITKTLECLNYLARDGQTGKLRLGTGVLKFSYTTQSHSDLVHVAAPLMRRLSQTTRETVTLHVEIEPGVLMEIYEATLNYLRSAPEMRITRQGLTTAAGKLFVAFGPEEGWETLLSEPLPSRTERSVTDPDLVREELIRARRDAVAFDLAEYDIELAALAAPVFGRDGAIRATLSLIMPIEKAVPKKMERGADSIRKIAADVSQELGAPLRQVAFLRNRSASQQMG
jgi:DNA-binding IclR family transcriptional regulator